MMLMGVVGLSLGLVGCSEAEIPEDEVKLGVVSTEDGIGAEIEEALQEVNVEMEGKDLKINVDKVEGGFAMGGVTEVEGGGVGGAGWMAAKVDGEWMIVWNGNGVINCESVNAVNFPTEWVSECWDGEKNVVREKNEISEVGTGETILN